MTLHSLKKHSDAVKNILKKYTGMDPVIPIHFLEKAPYLFDFSNKNKKLKLADIHNAKKFIGYVSSTIQNNNCMFGAGGYGEDRIIYRRSHLFEGDVEPRSIHLGIDVWMPVKTPVYSPLPALIHSFKDNNTFGDYGPTIILQHSLNGVKFYTLYGHLSRSSLKNLRVGMKIKKGQQIALLGKYHENGQWPAHLHFQIISDVLGKRGDFPGVASLSEQTYYLTLCPDPNLILRIAALKQ